MRLKKLMCLSAAIAAAMVSWAVEVSPNQASTAVQNWIRANPCPMSGRFSTDTGVTRTYSMNGKAIYHVVQLDDEGFVVTSGDTRQMPIIAFSTTGRYVDDFQNPLCAILQADQANVRDALDRYDERDAANPQASQDNDAFVAAEVEWERLLSDANPADGSSQTSISDVRVAKLIQTKWGQSKWGGKSSAPDTFNKETPNNYVCGCVATAGAQIMKFWEMPTGYLSSFGNTCGIMDSYGNVTTVTKYTIAGSFSWGNMPLSYDSTPNITDTQRSALGMLTYNIGVAVGMEWGPSSKGGSSANTGDLTTALRQTYNYRSGTFIWYWLGVGGTSGLSDFKNALYASLDAGMPVSVSIGGGDGGHSVIADGYGYSSGTLYTHLNMGWSGSDDVWYNLVNESIYCSEQGYNFTQLKGIGFNIHPSVAGDVVSGRVLNTSGSAVSGATVKLYSSSGSLVASTTSNAKGIYSFRISSSGSYSVQAEQGSSKSQKMDASVSSLSSGGDYDSGARTGNKWGVDLTLGSSGSSWPYDNFASAKSATPLTAASGSSSGSNTSATTESGEPMSSRGHTVWWAWKAPSSGKVWFSTEGSSFDTYMGIYTGSSVSSLSKIDENDDYDSPNRYSRIDFTATAGTTYYICVSGYSSSYSGSITLKWQGTAPPNPGTCTVWYCAGAHGKRTGGGDMKQAVPYGSYATNPTIQAYPGWVFTGWDKPNGPITDNTAITALYRGKDCGVTFDAGAKGYHSGGGGMKQTIPFCGKVTNPPGIKAYEGWKFLGWEGGNLNFISRSVTFTAVYDVAPYTATFVIDTSKGRHVGGGAMKQTVSYKNSPAPPGVRAKAGYVFKGWSPAISGMTKNQTYTAVFQAQ